MLRRLRFPQLITQIIQSVDAGLRLVKPVELLPAALRDQLFCCFAVAFLDAGDDSFDFCIPAACSKKNFRDLIFDLHSGSPCKFKFVKK